MIKSIPLNRLVASPRNVRRATDDQADRQLEADIAARGLLQNLVVTAIAKPRGSFAVEAGGRRLRALQALAAQGKLPKTYEVNCLVLDDAPAAVQEASLAENFQRLSMNPADECLAFQALIEQGADAEGIARRFGLTVRFVEGRLRLAGLAPVVFAALGAGEISLDVAKAYAASSDQDRQAYVFEQMGRGYGGSHPDSIRRMMTQASVSASDRRALFVGADDYLAAGGRIERDLFADETEARWPDVALLERLAGEKLQTLAEAARAESGFAWVRPTLERWISYADTEGLRRVPVEPAPLSDEESALLESLEEQIGEQVSLLEDEETSDEARAEAEAAIRDLDARIDAITDKPPVVDVALLTEVGAFLMLDERGCARLDSGRYVAAGAAGDGAKEGGDGADPDAPAAAGAPGAAAEPKRANLSQRLFDELAIQRRDILGAHVAADPAFALDLAIFLMVDPGDGYCAEKDGSSLRAAPPSDPIVGFKTPEAAATAALVTAGEKLDRGWCAGDSRAQRLDVFRALPATARMAWLGHAVARTLEASLNLAGPRACAFHDHLGALLGIDVARWWRPTGANYFDRVPKSMALEALAEVGGPAFAALYSGMKKAELAQSCERVFAGEVIAEAEVKQAALAWVPEAMRFAAPEPVAEDAASEADPDLAADPGGQTEDELAKQEIGEAA